MNNALRKTAVGLFFAGMIGFVTIPAAAQQVSLSTTIKNKTFQPSVLKAPANRPIVITIHNADGAAAEFESSDFHREKVIQAGGEVTVFVGPLDAGTYEFFDDLHPQNRGHLIVK